MKKLCFKFLKKFWTSRT